MNRICFNTYSDWQGIFEKLDSDTCKELLMAVFNYGLSKEIPKLSTVADIAFTSIKPLMDRDWEKYERISERNKANSRNAGRHKKEKENPNNPLDFLEIQKNENNPQDNLGIQTPQIINNKEKINNKQEENNIESIDSLSFANDAEDKINYLEIVSFYNKTVEGLNMPQCVKLTDKRKQAIRARLKEYGKEKVFEAITRCAQSSFCNGQNDRNWRADIDFIFNANKMARILERKYDNDKNLGYGNSSNGTQREIHSEGQKALTSLFTEEWEDNK